MSGARSSKPRRKRRLSPSALDRVPAWVQMGVAVLTLVLAILTAYGLVGRPADPPPATPPASTPAAPPAPVVVITVMNPELDEIVGLGTFANVNLDSDGIFMIGQPKADPEADWVVVRAQATPLATAVGLANGDWRAQRPVPGVGFYWQAIVMPSSFGAGGGLDDLRANGPNTEGIKAVSAPFETD